MLTDDDEGSDTDVEEASDEDAEEKEEEDSDGDPDEALAKQYQQEVEDESSTEDEDDIDPEKKKIAKEKVNPYILSPILLIFLKQNLFSQTQMAVFFNKPMNDDMIHSLFY